MFLFLLSVIWFIICHLLFARTLHYNSKKAVWEIEKWEGIILRFVCIFLFNFLRPKALALRCCLLLNYRSTQIRGRYPSFLDGFPVLSCSGSTSSTSHRIMHFFRKQLHYDYYTLKGDCKVSLLLSIQCQQQPLSTHSLLYVESVAYYTGRTYFCVTHTALWQ